MAWGARNSTSTQVDDVPHQPGALRLGLRERRLGHVRRPGPPGRRRGEARREQRARAREVVRFVHGESLVTRRGPGIPGSDVLPGPVPLRALGQI